MIILGIDPSLASTGWYWINTNKPNSTCWGRICSDSKDTTQVRIAEIVNQLRDLNSLGWDTADYTFIESEAMGAKKSASLVQLAELTGAIRYCFPHSLSFPVTLARKMILGTSKVPDKGSTKASEKAYCDFMRANTGLELGDKTDPYDAYVIAKAGLMELEMKATNNLILMRLHDHKVVAKNNKGMYSYGEGKKRVQFRNMNKLEPVTKRDLLHAYKEIIYPS